MKKWIQLLASCLRISFFLCLIFTVNTAAAFTPQITKQSLVAKFDSLDATFRGGEGYSTYDNDTGTLAWSESCLLSSYLDMYEGTQDRRYLERFVRHADRIIANTDKTRGIKDYRGRSLTGWSATSYSKNNERIVWAVHTGMITYPLAKFVSLAQKQEVLLPVAKKYLKIIQDAVAVFDNNWVYNQETKTGYFHFDIGEPQKIVKIDSPLPYPFNMQLALGRTLIELAAITGEPSYKIKSEGLARHFKNHLRTSPEGGYVWDYWYGDGLKVLSRAEDISHGAIDVDFAVLCYSRGIVFTKTDLEKFATTMMIKVLGKGKIAANVDGTGDNKYWDAIGGWLELTPYAPDIARSYMAIIREDELKKHPRYTVGVAKLVKYYLVWKTSK